MESSEWMDSVSIVVHQVITIGDGVDTSSDDQLVILCDCDVLLLDLLFKPPTSPNALLIFLVH